MKKTLFSLVAVAALAAPSAAFAHHGHHWHHWHHHHAVLAKVSGTGTSFAASSATASGAIARSDKLGAGTFATTLTTDWTKATTRTGMRGTLSCAPSTAAVTLTGATTTNTVAGTLTGKTCKWTPTSGSVVSAFFGRGTVTGAGALTELTGKTAKAFLVQKADGSVKGAVFAGSRDLKRSLLFAHGEAKASHEAGDCHH